MTVDPRALVEDAIRKAQEQAKPPAPLQWLDMSNWDNEPVPERKWAIRDRVPLRQTGLFSGKGGTGKSILELTKNVAHVVGKDWLGSLPEIGSAFCLGAEDDVDELHIRLATIVEHYATTFVELADGHDRRGRYFIKRQVVLGTLGRGGFGRPGDGDGL